MQPPVWVDTSLFRIPHQANGGSSTASSAQADMPMQKWLSDRLTIMVSLLQLHIHWRSAIAAADGRISRAICPCLSVGGASHGISAFAV